MSYWFSSKKESVDASGAKEVHSEQSYLELQHKLDEQRTQLQKYAQESAQIQERLATIQARVHENDTTLHRTITELNEKIKEYQQVSKTETILYYDGSLYQGYIKDRKPDGYGIMVHGNGTRYVGGWKDGLYHGSGVLYYSGMPPWYAEWDAHQPHGYCTYDGIHYTRYADGVQVE